MRIQLSNRNLLS